MARKKQAKAVKAAQPAAAAAAAEEVIVVSSDQPEPTVIDITLEPSPAGMDSIQVAGSEADTGGSQPAPVRPSPRRSKRRAREEQPVELEAAAEEEEDDAASDGSGRGKRSPSSKRRKLPMRVKTTTGGGGAEDGGHRKVEIEIPISARRAPAAEPPAAAAAAEDLADPSEPEKQGKSAQPERAAVEATPKKGGGHIHFDDEADQFFTPLEAPAVNPLERVAAKMPETAAEEGEEEEESNSDDDAPPEAVSTSTAAAQTLKAAQITAKAVEQQAAAQKRKRKERDTLFKAQAAKRKRLSAVEDNDDDDDGDVEPAAAGVPAAPSQGSKISAAPGRQRSDKAAIPALLPAEFLESDSEEDEAGPSGVRSRAGTLQQPGPKRIKFHTADRILGREGRLPPDRRVGHTVYRVLGDKKDVSLAPKLRKHTKAMRMELLARRRPAQRSAGGGFLVKRK